MTTEKRKVFLNTVLWGIVLWLIGYVLGFIFFALVPKEQIGYYVMPLGILITLWVLFKRIKRERFTCYIGLGVIWTILAVTLDYIFLVKMLHASDYYQWDVYLYYALTLLLPPLVGWRKFLKKN